MAAIRRRDFCVGLAAASLLPKAASAETQIELWSFLDPKGRGTRSATMDKVLSDFQSANPGVTVKTNVIQYAEIVPQLLRAAKAGRVPDVVMLFSQFMPVAIGADTLLPLDSFFGALSEADRKDIVTLPPAYDSENHLYAIPWELRVYGLIYRSDIFLKKGISSPRTLADLKSAAQAIQTPEMQALGFTFDPTRSVTPMEWLLPSVVALGGKVLNENGSAAFANEQMERMLNYFNDLVASKLLSVDTALTQSDTVENMGVAGKVGVIANGTHRLTQIQERSPAGANWVFSVFPDIDDQHPTATDLQGWTLAIPKAARNRDVAWKLLQHWASAPVQALQASEAGYIPVRRSVMNSPSFNNERNRNFGLIDAMHQATERPLKTKWPVNADLLNDVLGKMVQQVITKNMSTAEAMKWGVATYNQARL